MEMEHLKPARNIPCTAIMTNVNCIASMYCQNTTSVLYMKGTQSRVTPKPFKARRKSIFFLFSFQVLHREFSKGWRASLFCNLDATPLKASANHRLLEFFFHRMFSKDSDASKLRLRATSCLPKQSSVKPRNYRYD